jgi:hypothetical protein
VQRQVKQDLVVALARFVQEFHRVGWLQTDQIEQCPHLEGDDAHPSGSGAGLHQGCRRCID